MSRARRVVAVVGPTAAGKSVLAVALARHLGGEVVNADSMQLYQGMDIGTAKLPALERGGVAHHLLDVWPVTRTATAADYQRLARSVIDGLLDRGVPPVLAGGSGLYVRAALDDLRFPGTDAGLRAGLAAELAEVGAPRLHARLSAVDAVAAASILPTNGRRILRALEVVQLTGRPYAATLPGHDSVYDVAWLGVDRATPELDERIRARVERMWSGGFVDEVRRLEKLGLRDGVTARRALGYASALRMLDGVLDEEAARRETVAATRRFARRQRSWFRRDSRVRWLVSEPLPAALGALAER